MEISNSLRTPHTIATPSLRVLVTGSASGIGAATALRFAREGHEVLLADINVEAALLRAEQINAEECGKAHAFRLNVAEESSWQELFVMITERFGGLDILVNNAGISFGKALTDMSLVEWHRVMSVNLDGVMLGIKYALSMMIPRRAGTIINIASASGIKASAGASAYCTSKAAVIMLTKAAALETAPHNIRINALAPGGVETPMWETMPFFHELRAQTGSTQAAYQALSEDIPLRRYASADEIADAVLYLASPQSAFITGVVLSVDGGYTL